MFAGGMPTLKKTGAGPGSESTIWGKADRQWEVV